MIETLKVTNTNLYIQFNSMFLSGSKAWKWH